MLQNRGLLGWFGVWGVALLCGMAYGADGREQADLNSSAWRVWLDEKAEWSRDTLYLPEEVNLKALPINPPTGGWRALDETLGVACSLPACVEELFSGGTNAWTYHGVSWFWRTVDVPKTWEGKRVYLEVEKARLRVELFVNEQLAGYDLVAETPLQFDVTPDLKFGQPNRLAFRLTNPGGNRGWEDFGAIKWGTNELPASHDFGGLGHVILTAKSPVHVNHVFVKNELPAGANKITIQVSVNNATSATVRRNVRVAIRECGQGWLMGWLKGEAAAGESRAVTMPAGLSTVTIPLAVPSAKRWDMDHPNLYTCTVSLSEGDQPATDCYSQDFGFRVFEVKAPAGDPNYYLNGQRLRLRSAIDWGYYALTGFYATDAMARKSVEAARAIGHNSINFHRRIGEPLVFQYADQKGLYLYEEPGGFHIHQHYNVKDGSLAARVTLEKVRRMILRDRNHPSLLIYNLCNEDNGWNQSRDQAMRMARDLDGTRLVSNTSGANLSRRESAIKHIRPYELEIRSNFIDDHTVRCSARFNDDDLLSHQEQFPSNLVYWGEVRCYTGPANWPDIASQETQLAQGRPGYDLNIYQPMAAIIEKYWRDCRVSQIGSRTIQTPSDVPRQAGRGLMYIDGRLSQTLMRNDNADGFAINGWSAGSQMPDAWDSAICDEGRNLKGPASDFAYWTRTLQVVIARAKGKYFKPGETATFELGLVNEGRIPAGDYVLTLSVADGAGHDWGKVDEIPVKVAGGEVYAQALRKWDLLLRPEWRGGYVTITGVLTRNGRKVADGVEQVLLANRASFKGMLNGVTCAVQDWAAASNALSKAGCAVAPFDASRKVACVLAGEPPSDPARLDAMLGAVREQGTTLLVRMNEAWAKTLKDKGLLKAVVTQWGGEQTGHWNGNGWGYLDHFIGNQAIPGGRTIGTTGWEVPENPKGFGPFLSDLPRGAYGAYLARQEGPNNSTKPEEPNTSTKPKDRKCVPLVTEDTLLVLIGTLDYGKGKIVLQAAYPVDQENAFSDLLFFNLVAMGSRHQW